MGLIINPIPCAASQGLVETRHRGLASLAELIDECLAKNPDDRPKDAMEMIERLEKLQEKYPWTNADARKWWLANKPEQQISEPGNTSQKTRIGYSSDDHQVLNSAGK